MDGYSGHMSPHLAEILYGRYPLIFAERHLPADQSCMPRGIETGDGWFEPIDALCTQLQWDADHVISPQPVAIQVKEKFGSLRFRLRHPTERQHGMVMLALELSTRLCEVCGALRSPPVPEAIVSSIGAPREAKHMKTCDRCGDTLATFDL